jgi:hypothetical protein
MSNWHPVLLQLFQSRRKADASKLWAKVRAIGFEPALYEMDDMFSWRRPFPIGDEYPDLPVDVLSSYRSEPWRERGRTLNIIDLARAIAAETGEHYRMYLMILRRMYRDRRIVTSGHWDAPILTVDEHEVPNDCTDLLSWLDRLGIKLNTLTAASAGRAMPCTQRTRTRTRPAWRYDPHSGVLNVTGRNFIRDLRAVKLVIETGQIPVFTIEAIVYRPIGLDVPTVMRGHVLSEWMIDGSWPDWLWHFQIEAIKKSA